MLHVLAFGKLEIFNSRAREKNDRRRAKDKEGGKRINNEKRKGREG